MSLKGRARREFVTRSFGGSQARVFLCASAGRGKVQGVESMAREDRRDRSRIAWHKATELVHSGTQRSQFGETSEAIFLNSGYVYDSAEQAEARFKGDEEGFVYSRYSNPTVA